MATERASSAPRLWRSLIARVAPPTDRDSILQDLEEELAERRAREPESADSWYRRQVLSSLAPLLVRRLALATRRLADRDSGAGSLAVLLHDLNSGWRQLRSAPLLSALVVLVLALGIGGSTAIFSLLNPILLRPLPYRDADRLVHMFEADPSVDSIGQDLLRQSPTTLEAWRRAGSLEELAAYVYRDTALRAEGVEARSVTTGFLTANLLPMLGVEPALGRAFSAEEDAPGYDRVVLLSNSLWRGAFGGDPEIVGREVVLDGEAHVVIGVMEPGFNFPYGEVRAWKPAAFDAVGGSPDDHSILTLGRLAPGVTHEEARAELAAIHAGLAADHPEAYEGRDVRVVELRRALVFFHDLLSAMMLVLLIASGFVLVIVCANVANLLLSRSRGRRQEIAVRTALGAGRGRIVSQLLTEVAVLAILGGTGGLVVARAAIGRVAAFAPDQLFRVGDFTIDGSAVLFATVSTLLTAGLFGLAPARRASRVSVSDVLKEGRADSGRGSRGRLGRLLVFGQIAVATFLCGGAWLAVGAADELGRLDPGLDPEGVLALELVLPRGEYPSAAEVRELYRTALEAAKRRPEVQAAGWIDNLPADFAAGVLPYALPEGEDAAAPERQAAYSVIAPGYLASMSIPLLAGRSFDDRDGPGQPPAVIVNELLAASLWPEGNAVGAALLADFGAGPVEATVVGVAGDSVGGFAFDGIGPQIYAPVAQRTYRRGFLTVRSSADPATAAASIRAILAELDPNLPVDDLRSMEEVIAQTSRPLVVARDLLAAFGAFALLLAALGVYGVAAYAVSRRTHEIGVRMALGARPQDVVREILRSAGVTVILGASLGAIGTLGLEAALAAAGGQGGISPTTAATVALLLVSVAALASWLPARRAARVDPIAALQDRSD